MYIEKTYKTHMGTYMYIKGASVRQKPKKLEVVNEVCRRIESIY